MKATRIGVSVSKPELLGLLDTEDHPGRAVTAFTLTLRATTVTE